MSSDEANQPAYAVLVGVDYSELSASALAEALELARHRAGSHVHVLHSIPAPPPVHALGVPDLTAAGTELLPLPITQGEITPEVSRDLQSFVEAVFARAAGADAQVNAKSVPWTMHLRLSDPAEAILALAEELQVAIIVVGTHARHGLERWLLGSVAEAVVRRTPCPVLVVPPSGRTGHKNGARIPGGALLEGEQGPASGVA